MTARMHDMTIEGDVREDRDGAAPSATSSARPRRGRRAPEWLATLGVGAVVWLLGCIPQWRGAFFYYNGDQYDQNMPLWHLFGDQLRAGHWPLSMDPAGWMGGNNAAEALTGMWNPVNLANFVLVSHFDDLSLAGFVISVEFLGLLAMGTFLLARSYGASRWPAAAVGVAVPFTGFTLWYEAGGWPYHLMAFTWAAWFWWAAHRTTQGRLNPLAAIVFGALTMTTGSPYGAAGVVVVLAVLAVELLVRRRFDRLIHLAVVGACVGASALPVYLPLLASNQVSWRAGIAGLANDTFMVPDLGDLAASSSPSYLPSITQWGGPLEVKPSVFFAWFVLPLLPWVRWDRLRSRARSLVAPIAVAVVFLLATLGPSNMWLFRWPIRFIDYLYLAVAVLVAVALSPGLATSAPRRRGIVSAAIVAGGAYLAWAVRPSGLGGAHVAALLLVAALVALAVVAARRRGLAGLGVVLLVGTAAVLTLQAGAFPYQPGGVAVRAPYDVAALQKGASPYEGTVMQVAAGPGVTTEQLRDGEFLFGNMQELVGHETLGSYTGIGFARFASELCMDYRGAVCSGAFDRLWAPTGDGIPAPLVDSLRVSTLVLQRVLLPDVVDRTPPAGWRVAGKTAARTVWVRERPLPEGGRVSWSSPSVAVLQDSSAAERETVRYLAPTSGRVLFARLAWPGYDATVDGRQVHAVDGPAGLLAVDVPAGEHTLTLSYAAPGQHAGALVAAAAGVLALVQAVVWELQRRRARGRREAVAG